MSDNLPPLRIEDDGEHYCAIDELVPGFIEARSDTHSGDPVIEGTRMIATTYWLWEFLDHPDPEIRNGLSRDQILVAKGFREGVLWQRSRKRRQRMEEAQAINYQRYKERMKQREGQDYIPGDETI